MEQSLAVIVFLLLFVGTSCTSEREIKPQKISYGQDVCERCKMIISEKPFPAQYILPKRDAKKFDDLGCMFHYLNEEENRRDQIQAFFVRNYESEEWIDGKEAYYVWSKNIKTPMGYGLVTFKDKESAEKLARLKRGIVIKGLEDTEKRFLDQSLEQLESR